MFKYKKKEREPGKWSHLGKKKKARSKFGDEKPRKWKTETGINMDHEMHFGLGQQFLTQAVEVDLG